MLHSQRLEAAQTPPRAGGVRSWDLRAAGNATVEGKTAEGAAFFAHAARMSYDEAKGLLVLEGEPRSDVVLLQQKRPGDPREETRWELLHFWPKTGEATGSLRTLNLNGVRPLSGVPGIAPGGDENVRQRLAPVARPGFTPRRRDG